MCMQGVRMLRRTRVPTLNASAHLCKNVPNKTPRKQAPGLLYSSVNLLTFALTRPQLHFITENKY